jgi:hypothetical protein
MNEQITLILISAVLGGLLGTLFSVYIPRLLFNPRVKIIGIDYHFSFDSYNLIVLNKGKTVALNAVGRITIRPIRQGSLISNRTNSIKKRDHSENQQVIKDWRENNESWLGKNDWKVGIEVEHVYWATYPNSAKMNLNPSVPERLAIAHSEGKWINIASESFGIKRARLALNSGQTYYGEVIVAAENCQPSRPFRFKIILGDNGKAVIEPYKGILPDRT